jgi:LPXTG-site transpeptidase (sortase) family protein
MENILDEIKANLSRIASQLFSAVILLGLVFAQMPAISVGAAGTDLSLTKTVEGNITEAQVGDVIRYRIHFACSNLTTPCGPMEITDVLQAGLIYQSPPASSVPAGFTMSYNASSRTITITKNDNNLLDGSQYDAVIAVQVDYDLRPLPTTINNTVNGRIAPTGPGNWENANPSSAPPVTIDGAYPHWNITKSLSRPTINPTVNTDVTYQIQLCPTAPPPGEGNVPLSNVTLTDTLPAGATFVSASNGGTESSGTVTWPAIAGPIYPPNCVTRYVTVRYNSPTFSVTDVVTNTAGANGVYTDKNGVVGPAGTSGGITHAIDPISEVPTYSKDDTGDPVGFTGTGRFILHLNTQNTNFPSNELMLIDNLPPQLQVTSVASGQWSSSFDFVHAYVEYSTNNGSSYTAFPGQPIIYNTNATYVAPVANITNVRWRFEYDPDGATPFNFTQPGLPYTWTFTSAPEIRVTPRSTATIADPPSGTAMPTAIAGNTYDNCLAVSRRNSSGNLVTDTCNIEQMTVQGSFVSLRTSKTETPGTVWDDLGDPDINSFSADSSILPGDTLKYTLTVEITERSSAPLIDPTILDTLPPTTDFIFVRNGIAQLDGTPLSTQPTFSQPTANQLKWDFSGLTVNPLPLGSRFLTIDFYARIPRGQAPGTYTNYMYTVTDSVDALCENGTQEEDSANGDVDGDNASADPACKVSDPYIVERSAALRGEKWIRSTDVINSQVVDATTFLPSGACPNGGTAGLPGGGSNPFTRYPCIAQAFPKGALPTGQFAPPTLNTTIDDFEYNLRIFNDGNVPMLKYVLYDILPYVGDTGSGGTLSGAARNSEFRALLNGPVDFISGPAGLSSSDFTIEYNDTTNPCRPEVFDQPVGSLLPAGCDNTWSSTWSTFVRSYRIRLNSGSIINPASTSSEVRFGVPMYIPDDAPPTGFDVNDALSREIAWNSFAHVGSYDKDPDPLAVSIEDLLASEPRKVGITVPERMSVGNRVWRDADNNGTINAPDDTNPGIANVTVNLYRDTDNNGVPDGVAIGTTTTDTAGYYLFSNIPYDVADMNNNRYIVGIPASNFGAGQPLESLRSSTGTPAVTLYTNPPSNVADSADDGIDPVTAGQEVLSYSFILQPATEPTSESDLSANARDGLPGQRRGINGERDNNSDLTIDFGFFGGTDVPFSIGNHVWYDNGNGGGVINDGIRQPSEPPVAGVTVRLYRDGNANGTPEAAEMIRTDITDVNGFYLFDNLDPGPYYVEIAASNFAASQPLAGWYSSQPTGTETVGVNGGTTVADIDNDDNGINTDFPETDGVFSGVIILVRGTSEPIGETFLSGDTSSAAGFNPTGGDGPGSIGRFGETDASSNMTIDFGFIPPMSLGNRVWIDEGAGTTPFRAGFNNGLQDGTEAGVNNVRVELWRDTDGTTGLNLATDTFIRFTTTDTTGYYLFDRLQPASDYFIHIPTSNFAAGGPLRNYLSSTDASTPADDTIDKNDNGIDNPAPATNGINSPRITMAYTTEPLTPANEIDVNNSGTYGTQNRGLFGQSDGNSNLTMDFGFVHRPRSLGNYLWIDTNNNGQVDAGEGPVPTGVRVSLYLDTNADGQPDDLGVIGDRTDDWVAFDLTDANGYYLFDNLPPNNYIVGVDRLNFASGGLLEGYNSSTGNVDNASNNTDDLDNGVDRLLRADPVASPHGILSTRINLTGTPVNAPTGEVGSGDTVTTLGFNPTAGDGANSRGRYGETDANSDLTIDFGFFIPMSIGNRVFLDDGTGGGTYNNGIMDGGELPIANVRVELYRDADTNGIPDAGLVAFDTTDAGGYYLFDDLAEGSYIVVIPSVNFTGSAPLVGYNTSTPTGTENTGVAGNPYTPNTDRDDNGLNTSSPPATSGIRSDTITLSHGNEPTAESELSGQVDTGSPANLTFNPTGWDGLLSRGRWEESDANSNLTIDFGFIPVFSLGNRVWFDTNNNSSIDTGEVGVDGVAVRLFASNGTTEINVGPDGILNTADDAPGGMLTTGGGYYLFNNLLAGDYVVSLSASNFSGVLSGYWSSGTSRTTAGVVTETTAPLANTDIDSDDNGTLQTGGAVVSSVVTLGPSPATEPSSESDLDGGNQGQPDTQANMTVDFGFYTIILGNQVWNDLDNSGLLDGSETGIDGVVVELRSGDNTASLGTTTTSGGGFYTFSNLPAGDYIVRLPASDFNPGGILRDYRSSTGPLPASAYEPAPDADTNTTDSDDNGSETNGLLGLGGYIETLPVTLSPASEETFDNATGTTTETRVDFGVTNGPQIDLSVTKTDNQAFYIAGGTLNYVITVTNNGPADANGMTVTDVIPAQIASWTWTCAVGTPVAYNCTGATSNSVDFSDSLDLPQLASVTYNVTAQVSPSATGDLTNSVTINPPTGMTDLTPPDNTANDTDQQASLIVIKDDGINVVAPDFTTTYTITVTNNGAADLTDIALTDTIPAGMSFASASDGGTPSSGQITWPLFDLASGASTTFTVQLKVADIASLSGITSFANTVHVEDDGTHTGGTPAESDDTDTDTLASTNVKTLTATNQAGSSAPNVLIGEILTYSIHIDIPAQGTITDLRAIDILDHGLAFVGCDPVSPVLAGSLVLGQNPCSTPGALTVQAEPVADTDPDSVNAGRHITFDFGTVQNNSNSIQTIVVNYQVIVLDITDNVDGVTGLNNSVEWQWEGGTLSGLAPGVNIVEPQLAIEKSVDPLIAVIDGIVTYTINISHTAESTAPAFDVLMTDSIPSGLALIPGSVIVSGSAGLPTATVATTATQISVQWASFPVGETATVTFKASFIGPSPVINSASVEWSSIQIDPNPHLTPQSTFNTHSTERRYDPLSETINDYRTVSSITLRKPNLPRTGFAPGENTTLPIQPRNQIYASLGNTWLEIPALQLKMPIVGIPATADGWDLTWLSNQAGYLEGTTYPGQVGTTGITGHVYLADGTPGPFLHLGDLLYGNQVVLHANGQRYVFEVRSNQVIQPNDTSVFKNDGYTWMTLITCKEYDQTTKSYKKRVAVRAVLVSVTLDK